MRTLGRRTALLALGAGLGGVGGYVGGWVRDRSRIGPAPWDAVVHPLAAPRQPPGAPELRHGRLRPAARA